MIGLGKGKSARVGVKHAPDGVVAEDEEGLDATSKGSGENGFEGVGGFARGLELVIFTQGFLLGLFEKGPDDLPGLLVDILFG